MPRSLSFDDLIESGTPEHRRKKKIKIEKLDPRGLFRRSRVTNQVWIDELLIARRLTLPQFSAAEMYLELLCRSGVFIKSPSLERGVTMTGRDVAGSIASKIMAISRARTRLIRDGGRDAAHAVEVCLGSNVPVSVPLLCVGLDVLADYFGISEQKDPRDLMLFTPSPAEEKS